MEVERAACVESLHKGEHDGVVDVGMWETQGVADLMHKRLKEGMVRIVGRKREQILETDLFPEVSQLSRARLRRCGCRLRIEEQRNEQGRRQFRQTSRRLHAPAWYFRLDGKVINFW